MNDQNITSHTLWQRPDFIVAICLTDIFILWALQKAVWIVTSFIAIQKIYFTICIATFPRYSHFWGQTSRIGHFGGSKLFSFFSITFIIMIYLKKLWAFWKSNFLKFCVSHTLFGIWARNLVAIKPLFLNYIRKWVIIIPHVEFLSSFITTALQKILNLALSG